MWRQLSVAAFGFVLGTATPAEPQASVDSRRLVLGTDSANIYAVQNDTPYPAGRVWDTLRRLDEDHIERIYRTQNRIFGPHLDTAVSTIPELWPVSYRSYTALGTEVKDYADGGVTGWSLDSTNTRTEIERTWDNRLRDAGSFDLVLRSLDTLFAGQKVRVESYLSNQDTIVTLTATVEDVETIPNWDTDIDAWRVEADFVGLHVTFWIAVTDRTLARQIIRLGPSDHMLTERR